MPDNDLKQLEKELVKRETTQELYLASEILKECSKKMFAVKLVERIVFGFVGLILVSVVGALLSLIIMKASK